MLSHKFRPHLKMLFSKYVSLSTTMYPTLKHILYPQTNELFNRNTVGPRFIMSFILYTIEKIPFINTIIGLGDM